MKKTKLKKDILFGAISISVFIIIVSMTAVVYVINKQNDSLSFDILNQSFRVIFDELTHRQNNLLDTSHQMALIPKLGMTIKFMVKHGKHVIGNVSLASTYQKLALQVGEITQAAKLWKIAIYDFQGDLMAFAVMTDKDVYSGYAEGYPSPVYQISKSTKNKDSEWKQYNLFEHVQQTLNITPYHEIVCFEKVGPYVCLVAYIPIYNMSNPKSQQSKPLGYIKAIDPLDLSFVNRLSHLTDTQVNIYHKQDLTVGSLSNYNVLSQNKKRLSQRILDDNQLIFNEIVHNDIAYVQAIFHLDSDYVNVGSIVALYSKEIAKQNTIQMIKTLLIIALICIGIIIPLAYFFSNTISKPIHQIVSALIDGIAYGDFSKELSLKQTGEIGELVQAFQTMRHTISLVSHEINTLMTSIQNGDLSFRADTEAFSGEWKKLIIGINNVVNAFIVPINVTASMLDLLAKGAIPDKLQIRYNGDFNVIIQNLNELIHATLVTTQIAEAIADGNLTIEVKERSEHDRMMIALNQMVRKLNEIMNETNTMIQAVDNGQLDIRGNSDGFDGGWREMVSGVNHLIAGLSQSVSKSASLSQEMALAKRIQTSLQPSLSQTKHPELLIAAEMIPADQVGGDFYDISFDQSGNLWFAIGDVSGHGVTSGLIMMMAQTMFTTLINQKNYDPAQVVIHINQILFMNVCLRLKEKHFMTFTALKYLGQGLFQYAGAHLSLIVFRHQSKTFELIQTRGVYLNFKKDISRATKNAEFILDVEDILFLYTDGLTEAINRSEQMIDLKGFMKIIEKYISHPLGLMKDSIISDVLGWCYHKISDDMTIVIIKRISKKG